MATRKPENLFLWRFDEKKKTNWLNLARKKKR
jgi:hypothetical protein